MQSLYIGSLLWVIWSDGSDGGVYGWLLLRRRSHHTHSIPVSYSECELYGRDVCACGERHRERHLSSRTLLSVGLVRSYPVSSRHQHLINGSAKHIRLSGMCEGLLLSQQRHCVGDKSLFGGLLLSQRHSQPHALE